MAGSSQGGPKGAERRSEERHKVRFDVDYRAAETFLFAHITDISPKGIFITTVSPPPVGHAVDLRFKVPPALSNQMSDGPASLTLKGVVQWVTQGPPNAESPGMGIRFADPDEATAARIDELVRTVALITDD